MYNFGVKMFARVWNKEKCKTHLTSSDGEEMIGQRDRYKEHSHNVLAFRNIYEAMVQQKLLYFLESATEKEIASCDKMSQWFW